LNLLKTRAGRAVSGAVAVGSVAAIVAASTVMPAAAAAPAGTTLVANGITSPTGFLWLDDQTAQHGHLWVGDHAQGLCRVDPGPSGATLSNCDLTVKSIGQPAYDPSTHSVYVPDNAAKSSGVWRLTFDPTTGSMSGGGGGGVFGGGSSTAPVNLAPNKGLGGNRPFAVATDPNDNYALYIGFRKTPNILRIRHASVGVGDDPVNIGNSADGRQTRAMTMLSHITTPATATTPAVATSALAILDGNGVGFIGNPAGCNSGCQARIPASLANLLPLGVGSDNNVLPGGEASVAYIPDTTGVVYQYDAVKDSLTTLVSGLSFPTAAGVKPGAPATLYVGDDPSQGNSIGAGHIYSIP
jgi:hypothetical protein